MPLDTKINVCRSAPEVISDGHYTHASDVWAFGILAWELYASYKNGQQRGAISAPYFWLENKKVIFKAIAFGKRTLRLYTHTKVPITSSRETKPKILKEIRIYTDLYHAIENTANHDTGKPL